MVYLNRILMLKVKTMERGRQKTSEKKRVEQITLLPFNVRNYLNAQFHSSPYIILGTVLKSRNMTVKQLPEWDQVVGNELSNLRSAPRRVSISSYTYTWVAIRDALLCPPTPLSHSVYCSLSCHDEVGRTFLTETEFIYKARVFSARGLFNYSADGVVN